MPFADVNGAHLYFEQHGSGPDVVFLHGAGGNHLSWWQQLPVFAREFRCTVYDARGWGRSTGEMGVVAQSMGGRAVAGLTRLAPGRVRSLVLCGTTAGATNDRVRELQDELKDERGDTGLREYALAPAFEQAEPALALLYHQINALNPSRPRGFLGRPPASYRGSMHGPISALDVPVQFVVGEHDMITSPAMIREAQALVGGSRFHEVLGAGHSAYFERAEEWNRVVLAFLHEAAKGSP